MNNKCKNLKIKLNRKFECKKTKQIIDIKQCNGCKYKNIEHKEYILKQRTYKQAKKEKDRHSVLVPNNGYCSICHRYFDKELDIDEIFAGRNRSNSIKYHFILYLCRNCHRIKTNNESVALPFKILAQQYWEKNIGSREEFISVFGRSYL